MIVIHALLHAHRLEKHVPASSVGIQHVIEHSCHKIHTENTSQHLASRNFPAFFDRVKQIYIFFFRSTAAYILNSARSDYIPWYINASS